MNAWLVLAATIAPLVAIRSGFGAQTGPFQRAWTHVSETSAVLYWQLDDIGKAALSYVEFGPTESLGSRTPLTKSPRASHLHRLRDLKTGVSYHCRMVLVDPRSQEVTRSPVLVFTTLRSEGAIRIPEQIPGPPFILDKPNATYLLTQDVTADGDGFIITAPNVTLDLDGHTLVFGNNNAAKQVHGVWAKNAGKATICNGHIVQGARSKDYSSAVESRWRDAPTDIFGLSTDVHLRCAYPIKFLGKAASAHIHHNLLFSRVTEIESRHYPGNDLLRLDVAGGNIHVHDNLLSEGCHVGLRLAGEGPNVEIDHNDIQHHMQYVNGYALALACPGADVHHNRVTSCGRGVHLTREKLQFHDNYLDLSGHQDLDDMPQGSRPWRQIRVELHGIKFEGDKARECRVYKNYTRILQRLPVDSDGQGSPDDKVATGVYVRSKASALAPDRLADATQRWERDRWKGYFAKYATGLPPALIAGNDATTLFGQFQSRPAAEYTVYAKWDFVPATPLNFGVYDPNGMNEVFENTFVALTDYRKTRHGGYADSGQWAAAIYLVGMDKGPAQPGRHAIWIHDNHFLSNDLFVASSSPADMTIRIERNRFTLVREPAPTEGHAPFWRIGPELEGRIKASGNTFEGMAR